ncbi:MAG: C4-dicarboxylate ABC transporter [Proteobacteria bacterium]|nr:C4-dicarboxylate ABC transporter [Pseudomonadota bacterium]
MRNLFVGLMIGLVGGVILAAAVPTAIRDLPKSGPLTPAVEKEAEAPPRQIQWRLASAFGSDVKGMGDVAKRTTEILRQISDGDVSLSFEEPGSLVPTLDLFDAVSSGTVEAAFASPAYWGEKESVLPLFGGVPFGPGPGEFIAWFRFGNGGKHYRAAYKRRNIYGLACGIVPAGGGGWFRSPVKEITELKGMRIAAVGLGAKVLKASGAVVVPLAAADLPVALKRGTIDGVTFSTPESDGSLGFSAHAKHLYFPAWSQQSALLDMIIHLPRWDALSDRQRGLIETVCAANIARGLAEGEGRQFETLKGFVLAGVNVERLPEDFISTLETTWDRIARDEARGDRNFEKAWRSLLTFRENHLIWQELEDVPK